MTRVAVTVRPVRRFLQLSQAERGLLIEAAVVLGMIRLGLWVLPLGRVRTAIAHAVRRAVSTAAPAASSPEQAGWAVTAASRYIPAATCLVRALAVQAILQRRGYRPDVRIGLARGSRERVEGHAWVEHEGAVIFGHGFSPQIVLPTVGGRHGRRAGARAV